jgi:glucosyl-3-phosphoglycerate synthase
VARGFGIGSIVQCDLGERVHRNRPLSQLAPQAATIMQLALARSGGSIAAPQRPPLAEVPAHRKTA